MKTETTDFELNARELEILEERLAGLLNACKSFGVPVTAAVQTGQRLCDEQIRASTFMYRPDNLRRVSSSMLAIHTFAAIVLDQWKDAPQDLYAIAAVFCKIIDDSTEHARFRQHFD